MHQNNNIKLLVTYGCLFICLVFLILTAIPIVGYFAQIGAVLGMLLFSYRGKYLFLILCAIGSLVLAVILFGFSFPLMGNWALVIFPAILLGRLIASGVPPIRGFLYGGILAVLISLILFYVEKDLIYQAIDNLSESAGPMLGNSSTSAGTMTAVAEEITKMFAVIRRLIPSLLALSGVTQLFMGWIGLIILFKSIDEFFPAFEKFVYWKMPYYYIYILGVFIMTRLIGNESMQIMADNAILFIGFFYAVVGFSVFEFYLKKIRLSLFMRILFYIGFILLQLPGLILAALVGFFDSYFDFRKVRARIIG